ncbi:hypothetical protein NA78x_003520 [Anatilimnocola sp. NA78]|uniref:hypothetical protein n=1 Tax=Anatilimnocola sp. NA78 TaxID=3415683 RepID=UPI003CE5772D
MQQCLNSIATVTGGDQIGLPIPADQLAVFRVAKLSHQLAMVEFKSLGFATVDVVPDEVMLVNDIVDRLATQYLDMSLAPAISAGGKGPTMRRPHWIEFKLKTPGPHQHVKSLDCRLQCRLDRAFALVKVEF